MNLEDNGIICIVNYITRSSAKRVIAQEALKDRSQAFSSLEMIVKPDSSESLLANNKSNLRKKSISAESSSNIESDIPVIYSSETIRKAFHKCKQSTNKPSAAKKWLKKIKTNAKFLEKMLKPTRFYLFRDDDFATRVKHEEIK